MRPLYIIQTIASINEATGGTAVSVTGLAAALVRRGERCSVLALDFDDLGPPRSAGDAVVELQRASRTVQRFGGMSPRFRRLLVLRVSAGAAVVHNNGLWLHPNRYARIAALGARVPLVISPRGMLEPWARQRGRVKKAIAWRLYESANVRAAMAFHATSGEEARSIRACGVRAPIAVIPNGVAAPLALDETHAGSLRRTFAFGDERYVLFLSRLHPKKGIDLLLDAWRLITADHPDVRLVVAGPDANGYRAALEARARRLGVDDVVRFVGPVDGERKAAAFAHADLFVLPSYSENFGIVVAEALAHGVPVVTTVGTPWRCLVEERCGWWIEPDVDALAAALRTGLALPTAERRAFGARGRDLVRDRMSWETVAADMVKFYSWICDDHCRPAAAPTFLAE